MTAKCVDEPPRHAFRTYASLLRHCPLFAKSCSIFQISSCLFSLN